MNRLPTGKMKMFLAALCLLCAPAGRAAAPAAGRPLPGLNEGFFKGAELLSESVRKGTEYTFRSLRFKKAALLVKLEISSPLGRKQAGAWVERRLEVYRQVISPAVLDYAGAADREVRLKKEFRGELLAPALSGCAVSRLAVFAADKELRPVVAEGVTPSRMAVAGFFYDEAAAVLSEAVMYFPAAGFDRRGGAASFVRDLCPPGR